MTGTTTAVLDYAVEIEYGDNFWARCSVRQATVDEAIHYGKLFTSRLLGPHRFRVIRCLTECRIMLTYEQGKPVNLP